MTPDAVLDGLNTQIAALVGVAIVAARLATTSREPDTRWMAGGAAMLIVGYALGRVFWAWGDEWWPVLLERTAEARTQRIWFFAPVAQLTVAGGICMIKPLLEDWLGGWWFVLPYAGSLVILAAATLQPVH